MLGWAPPESGSDELGWLTGGPWAEFGLLVILAVVVLFVANMLRAGKRGAARLRSQPDFDLEVARLERLPASPITSAAKGNVHVEGVLVAAEGALGEGPRAMVFHNRAGGVRATAVAAELVMLADETGMVGLENLDQARVIAPREERGEHKTISLRLGDRVQVLGQLLRFDTPRTIGEHPQSMVGTLGSLGPIQIRVLERTSVEPPATLELGSGAPTQIESTAGSISGPMN
jgi:hypothetical protein